MKNKTENPTTLSHQLIVILTGKTIEEAKELFPAYKFRATKIDGKSQIVTMEIRKERVNVEIENGVIVKVLNLG